MEQLKIHRFLVAQKWAVFGLCLSSIIAIILTFTHLADAIYFEDPKHQNVDLHAWMTPRYIALSYDLPRPLVLELLGIQEGSDFPKRLDILAERLDLSLDELTIKVRNAATDYEEKNND